MADTDLVPGGTTGGNDEGDSDEGDSDGGTSMWAIVAATIGVAVLAITAYARRSTAAAGCGVAGGVLAIVSFALRVLGYHTWALGTFGGANGVNLTVTHDFI